MGISKRQPKLFCLLIFILPLLYHSCTKRQLLDEWKLSSPGSSIELTVALKDHKPAYMVSYFGEDIILPSFLQLTLKNQFVGGFDVIKISGGIHEETWKPVYGEYNKISNNYNSLLVKLKEKGNLERLLDLEFRIYNEGITFRYVIPDQQTGEWIITKENSEFNFPEGTKAYPITWTEQCFSKSPVKLSGVSEIVQYPLTLELDNEFAAVLEANVDNYPRMQLRNNSDSVLTTSIMGDANIMAPFKTPWRVILLAGNEGGLIENRHLILSLNDECAIEDTSWVNPGKTISNEGQVPLETEKLKGLVDFASENNFRYVQLDWGWYGTEIKWTTEQVEGFRKIMPERFKNTNWEDNIKADLYAVAEGYVPYGWTEQWKELYRVVDLNMQELVRYAETKNVGICLYVQAGKTLPNYDMDSLFATYREWGIAGLKPGFVKYGRQNDTEWIHKMVKTAAKHKLWLCIHDARVPDGFQRTYPNLMINEGGGGQERNYPAVQDVMLPFTRCLAGPFDYTPFFYANGKTNAHMLAFLVTYYGPAQTIRGAYAQKRNTKAELEFIRKVPTVWDDTKVLNAKIGEYLTIARRSGDNWFVGSMNGESPQTFTLEFDFLKQDKTYTATVFADDVLKVEKDNPVKTIIKTVTSQDSLIIDLAEAGGCVMILEPSE